MRFIRNMPWLRNVFPSSEFPREGPSLISDDVQYTSDFFGGGYSLREPQAWFSNKVINKPGDNNFVLIDLMPIGETVRIIKAGIKLAGGAAVLPLVGGLSIWSPDSQSQVPLSPPEQTIIRALDPASFVGHINIDYPTLVPGGSVLYFYFTSGDNVNYVVEFMAVSVPRGVMLIA